jgi:hypothetical protein
MPITTKHCGGCNRDLDISIFSKSKRNKDGLCEQCKECNGIRGKLWRKNNPEKSKETMRKWHIKHPHWQRNRNYILSYGITVEEANEIFNNQDGKCAICGLKLNFGRKDTAANLDHDHKTKKIRGYLCYSCNHGLGNFKDDINLLEKAKEYLCH